MPGIDIQAVSGQKTEIYERGPSKSLKKKNEKSAHVKSLIAPSSINSNELDN